MKKKYEFLNGALPNRGDILIATGDDIEEIGDGLERGEIYLVKSRYMRRTFERVTLEGRNGIIKHSAYIGLHMTKIGKL